MEILRQKCFIPDGEGGLKEGEVGVQQTFVINEEGVVEFSSSVSLPEIPSEE